MRRFVWRCVQSLGIASVVAGMTCAPPRRAAVAPQAAVDATPPPPPPCLFPQKSAGAKALAAALDRTAERAVVVVVLDGARWQEVFEGVDPARAAGERIPTELRDRAPMPELSALMHDRGVALGAPGHGAIVRASGPNFVSLPGYTELFTGRSPTACADNDCARTRIPTIADELRACAPSPRDVAVFSSWPEIAKAATARPADLVLSTGRHARSQEAILREDAETARLLDEATDLDPYPGYGDFRPDRMTAKVALRYLETARPRFLFMGLGEPDEQAHRGSYAGYLAALHQADAAIGELVRTLDRMGERGRRTSVFITADHGRAYDFRDHGGAFPESARVWLVALGAGIAERGMIAASEDRRLADLAPTIRATLGLPVAEGDERARIAGRPIPELLR